MDASSCSNSKTGNRFTGRVTIVTGGASGIGRATVERLIAEGAIVAVFDINQSACEKLQAELKAENSSANITCFNVDVSDKAQCVEAVKTFAEANSGKIHHLLNNAVYFGSEGLNAEKEDWDKSFAVNVIGYANMVQASHPYMSQTSGDKSIVNVASISAHRTQPNRWTYSATKGAVVTMTKCMAYDLSKDKIRVNSICPAWVWTPEVAKLAGAGGREEWEPIWGPFHMIRRLIEASEIAASICFLLSDDASCITATDLMADGGYTSMTAEGWGEKSSFAGSDY